MEAVLSDVILLIALVRHTEHISLFGHRLVKRGVENDNLRRAGSDNLLAGSERERVRVVMYGSKLREVVDLLNNVVVNESRLAEALRALYYSVSYRQPRPS